MPIRHDDGMQRALLAELHRRRFSIRARWDTLLHTEPVTSPLANPDALVHLIDTTIDEILTTLGNPAAFPTPLPTYGRQREEPHCPCGRNPLLAYFAAGAQAMREGLILSQAALAPLDPRERDASLAELNTVLEDICRREVEAFCGVCQFRHALAVRPSEALAAI